MWVGVIWSKQLIYQILIFYQASPCPHIHRYHFKGNWCGQTLKVSFLLNISATVTMAVTSVLRSSPLLTSWFCIAHLPRSISSITLSCEFFLNCLNRSDLGISWNRQSRGHLSCSWDLWLSPSATTSLYDNGFWGSELCITLPWLPKASSIIELADFQFQLCWRHEWIGIISHLSGQWNEGSRGKGTYILRNRAKNQDKWVLPTPTHLASSSEHTSSSPCAPGWGHNMEWDPVACLVSRVSIWRRVPPFISGIM